MTPPHSEKIHIRAGAFEGFRSLLGEYGIEPKELLAKAGIEEMSLKFPETQIPTNSYRRALNLAAELTNEPHFGLLMSQKQTLHHRLFDDARKYCREIYRLP